MVERHVVEKLVEQFTDEDISTGKFIDILIDYISEEAVKEYKKSLTDY